MWQPGRLARLTGVAEPPGDAPNGLDQDSLQGAILPIPFSPPPKPIDLQEAHGVHVGIRELDLSLERGVTLEQRGRLPQVEDHPAGA